MKKIRELFGKAKQAYGTVISLLSDKSKPFFIQNFIASLAVSFFATSAMYISFLERTRGIEYTDLAFVSAQHVLTFALTLITVAALLIMLSFLTSADRVIPITLMLSVTTFCFLLQNGGHRNIWLGIGIAIIVFIACRWIFTRFETPFSKFKLTYGIVKFIVAMMFVYFVGYMSVMGICRYYSFTYDTFDFGIFAQMFDYMKNTGLPFTTVERNRLLSHFAVHFSPFFYVLLPGYMLFSTPAYLCVAQTFFIGVSVFAVYGIAKTLGFSPKQTLLACALFLLYPAFSFGLHFDFHENKFLTFCILYAMYFLLKRKFVPFYIFAILLCTVKEDAAIYLVAIALFMLLREKLVKHGLFTLALALAYFVFALKMIEVCGATEENQFGYRYDKYALNGESTIGNIIKITVLDFGFTLSQMFQQEKVEFLLWMFLPVLFLPFLNKKVSTLVLLSPMLLVNLMTSWPYQHDIDYQYTFGTGAMIIVCTLLAISQMPPKQRNTFFTATVALSLVLTVPRVIDRNQAFIAGYTTNAPMFEKSEKLIDDTLNKKSVIGVEGNVMPMLYDYPYLVLDPHDDELAAKIEYFVAKENDKEDIAKLTDRGFELSATDGHIVIYRNPAYQTK